MNTPLSKTPLTYQGDEIKCLEEISLGEMVIDTTGGFKKVCKVIKKYKYSVRLEWTLPSGEVRCYGQSLHPLRRLVPEIEKAA